ncbi:DUF3014 domain-containing protein [Cellvibrio sp. PSBB006]|uniref:DUF3014 domain-containing protein n=1 Tax=Cellvibrio sp. PSBB006 TaxID=1987723 RepID=UPI000B3B3DAB|nr:DUF3014 domain-containing protein [Cellvibrio sp. PSBB006]ARU29137.1 hypothetical protein CBR65_17780 [Cellvibrio sp. PSBB006]
MANEQNKSITTTVVLVLVAAVVVAAIVFFYWRPAKEEDKNVSLPPPLVQTEPEQVPEPEPTRPVYEAPEPEPQEEPLPELGNSDQSVLDAFGKLAADAPSLIVPEESIRKFVRAVNAVEEGKVVHEYRPLVSPAPPFQVERDGTVEEQQVQQYTLSEENYRRYDKYVATFAAIETDALAALYKRFYPLLEEAYREMGLKKGNFHTVMLGAIDNLLAAPVVEQDILLVRPKVFYQYADPALEKLPASHKLLLRMGPDNTRRLQESLKNLRAKLAE